MQNIVKNIWKNLIKRKLNNKMKWDVILANPPFDNGLHEKFEVKFFDLCKGQICWVSPAAWLLGKRQNKKITSQIDKYNCDIESINGNDYFDAAIGGTMGIVYVNMNSNKQHIIYDNVLYNKCEQITTYSNDKLLMEFKNIIEPLYKKDNIDNHLNAVNGVRYTKYIINNPKNNPYIVIIPQFSGHSIARSKQIGEFYAMYSKDRLFNDTCDKFNIINKKTSRSGTKLLNFYLQFDNKNICYNFWKYTHTLFFTTCMRLIKNTLSLMRGELKYIPYFDFSNPIFSKSPSEIDDYLFKTFKISDEIRKHIEDILPDYYGIRKGQN